MGDVEVVQDDGFADEREELLAAVKTRDLIGQAKGMLMATEQVDADEAFAILVRASQRENVKVRDIAARLVATHEERIRGSRTGWDESRVP